MGCPTTVGIKNLICHQRGLEMVTLFTYPTSIDAQVDGGYDCVSGRATCRVTTDLIV